MSEKKFEECALRDATHVKVGEVICKIGFNILPFTKDNRYGLGWVKEDAFIPEELFATLNIYLLKKIKRESIVFDATFAEVGNGCWQPLFDLDDAFTYQSHKKAKFRCVEILEDEE